MSSESATSSSSTSTASAAPSPPSPQRFGRLSLLEQNLVVFPGIQTNLEFYEPRHLLMLRQVLNDPRPTLGVVSLRPARKSTDPSSPASSRLDLITDWTGENVGTEVVLPPLWLSDQAANLTFKLYCTGSRRFKILHLERTLEGAYKADVEFIDEGNTDAADASSTTLFSKANAAHALLLELLDLPYEGPADVTMALPVHLNDLKASLDAKDLTAFSYKLAALTPAPREERQALLSSSNVESRLDTAITTLKNLKRKYSEPAATKK